MEDWVVTAHTLFNMGLLGFVVYRLETSLNKLRELIEAKL